MTIHTRSPDLFAGDDNNKYLGGLSGEKVEEVVEAGHAVVAAEVFCI